MGMADDICFLNAPAVEKTGVQLQASAATTDAGISGIGDVEHRRGAYRGDLTQPGAAGQRRARKSTREPPHFPVRELTRFETPSKRRKCCGPKPLVPPVLARWSPLLVSGAFAAVGFSFSPRKSSRSGVLI